MNATVGTSGILVILVGMALASFPVITTVPNASYSACMASLPASFCQSEYNQFLFTAEFQYRPAGEIVAIAGLVTFVAGALSKEEAFPGGGARRIHWALILIGGIAVLVDALVVLQIAGNATGMNASLHYVFTSSDPY